MTADNELVALQFSLTTYLCRGVGDTLDYLEIKTSFHAHAHKFKVTCFNVFLLCKEAGVPEVNPGR